MAAPAALVTGAARRLGRAIVIRLAEAGHPVAIHTRHHDTNADELARDIVAGGGLAAVVTADLADEAETADLVRNAAAAVGPLGVLVNNASVFERDEWDTADAASWAAHMAPNLRAPFVLTQQFAQDLPAGMDGVVINMLDQRVWSMTPHFVSYTVSKAGLWALTRTMALALAPRIRVNAIGPGPCPAQRAADRRAVRPAVPRHPARPGHRSGRGGTCGARHPCPPIHDGPDDRTRWRTAFAVEPGRARRPRGMIDTLRLAGRGRRHVFVRDMVLSASIGVHAHEQAGRQRIRVNVDLGVTEPVGPASSGRSRAGVGRDELGRVLDYQAVVAAIRAVVAAGHVMLVETLAERVAEECLVDERVEVVRVRVEKLDVYADLASVGVEIERQR